MGERAGFGGGSGFFFGVGGGGARLIGGPEIGAAAAGQFLGHAAAPLGDPAVMARHQHLRDRAALPLRRAGVMGVFQQPGGEAFLFGAGGIAASRVEILFVKFYLYNTLIHFNIIPW